ncbi:MAG: efflux RND transporter permease subunit, partial [Candidatus Eisenbacteria bacterium]|nr:efflux RND transporter permease subunit [Candidatus Eisenbacteria bacterium]
DENSQQVVGRVKAALPAIERSLPAGVRFNVFYDRTTLIDAVINTVSSALLQGGLLVILVLVLAMGTLRTALVTALSLPFTALIAFILMGAAGVTANLMSLGGLAIAIGMVVDGSIVVAENGARHLRESRGRPLAPVLSAAVGEVARPVAFSILTIVLVFLPLFTLEGMEGKMFKPLALTMGFAMLASLVAAFAFVPLMMSVWLRRTDRMVEPRLIRFLRERYLRLLARTLDHWRWTLGIAVLTLGVVLALAPRIGSEFLPVLDEGAVAVNVVRLPNASLEGSVATADYLERVLLELPEVTTVVSKTGRAEISEDPMGPEQTDLVIMLKPHRQWTTGRNKERLVAAMQERMAAVPGIRPAFSQPIALRVNELISGLKTDLAVKIFGDDIELLKQQADQVAVVLRSLRGAQDVSVEQVTGLSQLEVVPDRRALARHQINVADLNEIIETAVGGRVATEMVEGRQRTGVRVRFPAEKRSDPEAIRRILIPSPSGARIPLGEVAELRRIEGPAQVSRENGMRRVVVEVNIRGRDLGGFVAEARDRLVELEAALPPGYWLEYGGTFESQQRAMRRLAVVVPIAIGLILAMLYGALGSFGAAALVLLNVPFALMGGLLAMLILGIEMSVPAMVGFIALFGTAVQNDTVLVTFIGQLRRQGLDVRQAVLNGCSLRFRALLMTAATTVLGLTPMLYATGSGAEIQRPLAAVVIGGLVTATALTLLVLPTLYARIEGRRALPTS